MSVRPTCPGVDGRSRVSGGGEGSTHVQVKLQLQLSWPGQSGGGSDYPAGVEEILDFWKNKWVRIGLAKELGLVDASSWIGLEMFSANGIFWKHLSPQSETGSGCHALSFSCGVWYQSGMRALEPWSGGIHVIHYPAPTVYLSKLRST